MQKLLHDKGVIIAAGLTESFFNRHNLNKLNLTTNNCSYRTPVDEEIINFRLHFFQREVELKDDYQQCYVIKKK